MGRWVALKDGSNVSLHLKYRAVPVVENAKDWKLIH